MKGIKDELLFTLLKNYFLIYLPNQRNASPHTITTYKTVWSKFLEFAAKKKGIKSSDITMEMLDYDMVSEYLDSLSSKKGMTVSTRNNRLAAIRAFFMYASACSPEYMAQMNEISRIKPQKQDIFRGVDYMTEEAVQALLDAPNTSDKLGRRDRCIFATMYDTGARIQEILNLRICDLALDKTAKVILHGKGNKVRTVPLMKNTVELIKAYMKEFHPDEPMESDEYLFYTAREGGRKKMNDDTIRCRMMKYVPIAKDKCHLVPDNVHPHLLRHSRAMHLYQNGMSLDLISQWLGHSSLETTLIYAHADTEQKRRAIEAAQGKGLNIDVKPEKYTITDDDLIKRLYGL